MAFASQHNVSETAHPTEPSALAAAWSHARSGATNPSDTALPAPARRSYPLPFVVGPQSHSSHMPYHHNPSIQTEANSFSDSSLSFRPSAPPTSSNSFSFTHRASNNTINNFVSPNPAQNINEASNSTVSRRDDPSASYPTSSPQASHHAFSQPMGTPSSTMSIDDPTDETTAGSSIDSNKSTPTAAHNSLLESTKVTSPVDVDAIPEPAVSSTRNIGQNTISISMSSSSPAATSIAPSSSANERRPRRAKANVSKNPAKLQTATAYATTRIPVNMLPILYNEILNKLSETGKDNFDKYAIQSLVISLGLQNTDDDLTDVNDRYHQLMSECLEAVYNDTSSQYMIHGRRKNGRVELDGGVRAGDKEVVDRYHELMDSTQYRIERLYRNSEAAARYVWTREDFMRFKEAFRRFGYAPTANRQIAEYVGKGMHPNHIQYFKRALKQRLGGSAIRELIESSGYDALIAAAPADDGRGLADFLPTEESNAPSGTKALFGSTVGGTFFQSAQKSASSASSDPATAPHSSLLANQAKGFPSDATPAVPALPKRRGRPPKNRPPAPPRVDSTTASPLIVLTGSLSSRSPLGDAQERSQSNYISSGPPSASTPTSTLDIASQTTFSPITRPNTADSSHHDRSNQHSSLVSPSTPNSHHQHSVSYSHHREGVSGKRLADQLPPEAQTAKRRQDTLEPYQSSQEASNASNAYQSSFESTYNDQRSSWNRQYEHQTSAPHPSSTGLIDSEHSYAETASQTRGVQQQAAKPAEEQELVTQTLARLMKQTAELQEMVTKLTAKDKVQSPVAPPPSVATEPLETIHFDPQTHPNPEQLRLAPQNPSVSNPRVPLPHTGMGRYSKDSSPNDGSQAPRLPRAPTQPQYAVPSGSLPHVSTSSGLPRGVASPALASPTSPRADPSNPATWYHNSANHPPQQPQYPLLLQQQVPRPSPVISVSAPTQNLVKAPPPSTTSSSAMVTFSTAMNASKFSTDTTKLPRAQPEPLTGPAKFQPRFNGLPVQAVAQDAPVSLPYNAAYQARQGGYQAPLPNYQNPDVFSSQPMYPIPMQQSPRAIQQGYQPDRTYQPMQPNQALRNLYGDTGNIVDQLLTMDDYPASNITSHPSQHHSPRG